MNENEHHPRAAVYLRILRSVGTVVDCTYGCGHELGLVMADFYWEGGWDVGERVLGGRTSFFPLVLWLLSHAIYPRQQCRSAPVYEDIPDVARHHNVKIIFITYRD